MPVVASHAAYSIRPRGIEFVGTMSPDQMRALGLRLAKVESGTRWALGDWIARIVDEDTFLDPLAEAAAITGRSRDWCFLTAQVSRAFPLGGLMRSRPTVCWSAYREALRLPAQRRDHAIDLVHEFHWTLDDLRAHVDEILDRKAFVKSLREINAPSSIEEQYRTSDRPAPVGKRRYEKRPVTCPHCGHSFRPGQNLSETLKESGR